MSDLHLQFARGGAEFTVELFKKLAAGGVKENIVFSPFSIQTCLALAFAGAAGETAEEIAKAMKFVSNSPSEVAVTVKYVLEKYHDSELLKIANKVYLQEGFHFKTEYATTTKDNFYAEPEEINFAESVAAAKAVNEWVANKTAGKITDLVRSDCFDSLTRLVILNALHFKGDWEKKFDESRTEEGDFWTSQDESVKVKYMNQKAKFGYGIFEELNCQALEMPYKDSDLSMFILLPNERDGLKDLTEKLKDVNLVDLIKKMNKEEVYVQFPKFKVEYSIELCDILKELGITKAFGCGANFSGMLEAPQDMFLSKVIHKACIEVNEEGSEAAAATGMIMACRMLLVPEEFRADHPFLYMIWNKKNIIFSGAYVTAAQ